MTMAVTIQGQYSDPDIYVSCLPVHTGEEEPEALLVEAQGSAEPPTPDHNPTRSSPLPPSLGPPVCPAPFSNSHFMFSDIFQEPQKDHRELFFSVDYYKETTILSFLFLIAHFVRLI